ncbi:hypothetical protein LMG28688_02386 [Paraburkholderia caffeinitolerans]|uniref:Uncharacterized protein n=1 Tax=Paraburkholderia caffeinitolerans TaxID=1723730 RepID=A0A6J5FTD1_9BURK|nr:MULTISPECIES: hypothetical protein [Paraburkholderia]CAB3786988.1 hypothetical protein LMG28688_02386 [Paraburkholderia caffeinitolerans]
MSTYPLVQVEGALAMPRMRPLNRVPPPFGREWALMPPHFSLRTELQAFYAAILRTMCLSAEAFRKVCRWDLQRRFTPEPPRPAAAPVGSPLNAAQAQQAAADTLQRTAAGARPARRVERIPPPSHKLAASAIAIGGAVLLTWIVASHTQFGDGKDKAALHTPANPASDNDGSASARLSDERARHDLATPAATRANQDAPASAPAATPRNTATQTAAAAANAARRQGPASAPIIVTPNAAPAAATARGPATATVSGTAKAERPDFAARTNPGAPLHGTLTSRATRTNSTAANATKNRQTVETATRSAHGESRRHPAHDFTPHRNAPLLTTQRTQGAYSEASDYSPVQPGGMSSSDYPSLSTYAGTRAAPRPANSATVSVDNTEWVNHVSQRRVTEVPDHFAK